MPVHNDWLPLISIIVAYLLGSLSGSICLCRWLQLPDPRSCGSKNPGATNVLRIAGKKLAAMVVIIDATKGFALVYLAQYIGYVHWMVSFIALAVFLGQLFPIFFAFRGGKGIAVTLGIIFALAWQLAVCCGLIWIIIFSRYKISSLASIVATVTAMLASGCNLCLAYGFMPRAFSWIILVIGTLILIKHKNNMLNLLQRNESPINMNN